jgi:hypothetical protein
LSFLRGRCESCFRVAPEGVQPGNGCARDGALTRTLKLFNFRLDPTSARLDAVQLALRLGKTFVDFNRCG